jgi:predicted RNA-binding protein YlxR (DUF448 family)/ribosomal protein L30E
MPTSTTRDMNSKSRAPRTSDHGSGAPTSKRVPERTCIGCRQACSKARLLRVVRGPSGQLLLDVHGKLPARGAYLCPQRHCVEQAVNRARLREAFRQEVTPPHVDELVRAMACVMEARALTCIRMARKAGRVVSGYTQVSRALRHEPVSCLLIAEDTAPERRREYEAWCAKRQIPVYSCLPKVRLGELAGRNESSALGILDAGLSARLLEYLEGMSRLTER